MKVDIPAAPGRQGVCNSLLYAPSCSAPHQVFINRDDLDFSAAADLPAVQEWDLLENYGGQIEYPTQ